MVKEITKPSNWNSEWLKKQVEENYSPDDTRDKLKTLTLLRKYSILRIWSK